MTGSNPTRWHAYGIDVATGVDFSAHLTGGGAGERPEISLAEGHAIAPELELVHVTAVENSHGRDLTLASDRRLEPLGARQPWRFDVSNVVTFTWRSGERKIGYEFQEEGDPGRLAFWFIHMLLPLYLSIEEAFEFIHAGAVGMGDAAVLFVAPSTGGKSTLTEYFVRRGHKLLSDDKLATRSEQGRYVAIPSHANYRPYRRAEDLGFRSANFSNQSREISAVYALRRVSAGEKIGFREITGFRKFDRLLPNYIFGLPYMKERRLEYLAGLVNQVPIYEVLIPHDLGRLGEVYEAIYEHSS